MTPPPSMGAATPLALARTAPAASEVSTTRQRRGPVDGTPGQPGSTPADRLAWLDAMRLLTMVEILGFHWLRTCQENGSFGLTWSPGYEDVGRGLHQIGYLLTDQTGLSAASFCNNLIGLVFGYGWEAVNVFVMLSGIGLALSYRRGTALRPWYARRYRRILVPYYLACFPLILAAEMLRQVGSGRPGMLGHLAAKLTVKNLPDPLGIELAKHLVLIDPRQFLGIIDFFSPAWWFLPPILFAYLLFPGLVWLFDRLGAAPVLAAAFVISLSAYELTHFGLLPEHGWYFVALHECFDFNLAIWVGLRLRSDGGRAHIARWLRSPTALAIGAAAFVAGNVLSWFSPTHFVASCVFAPGLAILLGWMSIHLTRLHWTAGAARRWDTYFIYLLHQWIAFPLVLATALLAGPLAHSVGFAAGMLAYLCLVLLVVAVFSRTVAYLPAALR